MLFQMPQFERKNLGGNDWEKMSEKEFLLKLADSFIQITPMLSEMLKGNEISAEDCIYRIQKHPYSTLPIAPTKMKSPEIIKV